LAAHATETAAPIALIAPYGKLTEMALEARAAYPVPIAVHQGDLQYGVEAARQALREGSTIIVSRGGTARLIQERLGVQVVEIRVSSHDVLRATLPFIGTSEAVAVVGFADVIGVVRPVCDLLSIPAAYFPIAEQAELPALVSQIREAGFRHVIGDTVSVQVAAGHGLDAHLIETGEDAVRESLDKARAIYETIRAQVRKNSQLETLVSAVDENVLLIDGDGGVVLSNLTGLRRAGFRVPAALKLADLGDDVVRLVEASGRQQPEPVERVVDIGGRGYFATVYRLAERGTTAEDAVVIIRDISKIRSMDRSIRRQLRQRAPSGKTTYADLVHADPAMARCVRLARAYALTDSAVVLYGETGTGKEMFAQAIHNDGARAAGPFVAVNCGAIPPSLIESELFGYVEGAFTGAHKGGKVGLFEAAHGGTIFLDEINELDLAAQSRLLRVLQEREVMRIGDNRHVAISIRVIAASNVPLAEEVAAGRFRRDLLYRLDVLHLEIPALRDRPGDIRPLFQHFLAGFSGRDAAPAVPEAVLSRLEAHRWPGNVRELQNAAERFYLWATRLAAAETSLEAILGLGDVAMPALAEPAGSLRDIERRAVLAALAAENGNVSRAARRLGVDRNTLKRKLSG
jgi:transcriptional regulator with PAS, ATPase and Fis domain